MLFGIGILKAAQRERERAHQAPHGQHFGLT